MYLTKDVPEQSMGTWFFDKRTRKRKYVALSGKVYTGQEALKISRHDKYSPTHPAQFLRSQLIDLARAYTSDHLLFMSSTYGAESLSCLAAWGLPNGVVQEYARHHVTTLFPWQIDCLLAEQGVVFDGTLNLVFSAPTSGGKTLVAEMLMLRRMAQRYAMPSM
ncbi:hypothetical protein EON64_02190 [archaeon]|nr:MAG: hypothetical protein EON64_02190 [archaeon]